MKAKKIVISIMLCILVGITTLSGCTISTIDKNTKETTNQIETKIETTSEADNLTIPTIEPETANSDKPFESLSDYWYTEEAQTTFEQALSVQANNGVYVPDIYYEDNRCVYEYRYINQVPPEKLDDANKTLSQYLNSTSAVYVNAANNLNSIINQHCSVVCRYLNSDGSLIYEQEFE